MNKKTKVITAIASVLLLGAVAGLLTYEFINTGTVKLQSVFKGLMMVASVFILIIRVSSLSKNTSSNNYKRYELAYKEYIEYAFTSPEQKKSRKKLMKAIDLYNSNRFAKAISLLEELKKESFRSHDIYAVNFFIALSYSDMGAKSEAIKVYREILDRDMSKATVWSNLGLLYEKTGNSAEAESCYNSAIEWAPEDPYPYNNLAVLYLKARELDEAEKNAKKALDLKNNMYQASNTLAIIYHLRGDRDNAEKYFMKSVNSGEDPAKLKRTIEIFNSRYNG